MTEYELEQEYKEYLEDATDTKIMSWLQYKTHRTIGFSNLIKKPEEKPIVITKSSLAKDIYEDGIREGLSRKEIIELFIVDAGLTKAGAATYYANFNKK